jgi:two-component system KDP operon response regulator KdpE
LVCDDDASLLRALDLSLSARGYDVIVARSGEDGLDETDRHHPDVIVLDLGLPGMDGIEVIRRIRERNSIPIIVLSARHQSVSKVQALDAGADDYMTKPFGVDELLARLRATLRRAAPDAEALVETEAFTVDLVNRRVTRKGTEVHLTPKEWGLVQALVRRPGRLMLQPQLLHEIWGPECGTEKDSLRVLMARVRRKLEADPGHPRHFRTESGMGYRFDP